ncbi:MAG: hypothetical protein AAFR58_13865 [Cyanobacteria bacterium J06627_28]
MHPEAPLKLCSNFLVLAVLLTANGVIKPSVEPSVEPTPRQLATDVEKVRESAQVAIRSQSDVRSKTESLQGEYIGPAIDCDGDGLSNDSRIDFDGDGVSDSCVDGREDIPEPPFQQSYTPTSEAFYSQIPDIGWEASYQCGDGLYEVSLSRPEEDAIEYSAQGLTLANDIVYDDLDPNLNHPLIVKDPTDGIRYAFSQEEGGEYYEYAIADYSGNIGLYVYQTGEQIVAAPCESVSVSE